MLNELTYQQLYQSTVDTFPLTTKRQHSTDTITIEQLRLTPYLGMRTLFTRGLANNFKGGGGEYRPIIVFKDIEYHQEAADGLIEIVASNGQHYHLVPPTRNVNEILVRCECGDLYWRGISYLGNSRYGRDRTKYERKTPPPPQGRPYVNPTEQPMICKHLISMTKMLIDSGILL